MKQTKLTLLVSLILVLFIAGCAPAPGNPNSSDARLMRVSGTGVIEVEPDIARANIGVRTESPDVEEALTENNAIADAIIQRMMDLGIEDRDIQTRDFNLSIRQPDQRRPTEEVEPEEAVEPGEVFVVQNTVSVVVRDFDALGEVLAAAVAEGANTIHGVSFDIEDRAAIAEEARQLAIENAQAKAESIAETAGVALGAIQTIDIDRADRPVARPEIAMERAEFDAVPIAGGTLAVQVSVDITYQID